MSNIKVSLPSVDGSLYEYLDEGDSCKEVIHNLYTDDFSAPPVHMAIHVSTHSGKAVKVVIPYDNYGMAKVFIDNAEV